MAIELAALARRGRRRHRRVRRAPPRSLRRSRALAPERSRDRHGDRSNDQDHRDGRHGDDEPVGGVGAPGRDVHDDECPARHGGSRPSIDLGSPGSGRRGDCTVDDAAAIPDVAGAVAALAGRLLAGYGRHAAPARYRRRGRLRRGSHDERHADRLGHGLGQLTAASPRTWPTPSGSTRRRSGTAVRLAALHGGILAVALGAVAIALVASFSTSYQTVAASGLATELRTFARAASARPARESLEAFSVAYLESHALASGGAVLVALPGGGRVQTASGADLARSPVVATLLAHALTRSEVRATTVGNRPVELAAAPLLEGARPAGTIVATADLRPFAAERSRVLALSLAEAAVALIAGVASSYVLLRKLLRTVGRITSAADEIGRSSLDRRLGDQGTDDEVGDLARTFDEMLDRIETAMAGQRRLLADVSHQLRTPLTVARGHLEVLNRTGAADPTTVKETIDLVVDELGHMGSVVERLLMLGHAMDPDFLARTPVDLRALLGDCFAATKVLAPREFTLGPVPDRVLLVDEAKVRGAVLNLVANAVKATREGDSIHLAASVDEYADTVELVVEDSGPGIPANERAEALERFSRPGARSEGGTGLGLAIVKAVAESHGGRVTIGESRLGGARVSIMLPAGRAPYSLEVER